MNDNSNQVQPTETSDALAEKHLLIVDDEREFGEFVKTVAEAMGFKVTVTEKAQDFQASYLSSVPTHIVMDMVMPGIDGVELISWLAQQNCEANILIVTGFNPRYIELAEDLGGAKGLSKIQTLTKPVALADLRKALS
ncbi:response regulator [Sneathiella limimaris]|uniref:response regulator n=1 Tax=Sneathiella limimaris TaxID=1964213 RepID=UPI00146E6B15|nr:response regulator [Sneathiella limimaris]